MAETRIPIIGAAVLFALLLAAAITISIGSSTYGSGSGPKITVSSAPSMPSAWASSGNNPHLPVILVHGWDEDASIWQTWKGLLKNDNVTSYAVTFINSDDKCGSSQDHAAELGSFIKDVKRNTHSGQVNVVAHSKGGLDARVYLANGTKQDVVNLIMIGTPNEGSPLAYSTSACMPGTLDLLPGASAGNAPTNPNTK